MFVLELPWPNKNLSPNARPHWAVKAKAAKEANQVAHYVARTKLPIKPQWLSARLQWAFHPKTAHALDKDNCIASCKAYQDGIAMALGIDDSLFDTSYEIKEPVKGGKVVVTILPPL